VHDSLAKQKRRPFTVKNGDQTHHVYCCRHVDEIASFYCAVCHKPYDEQCVGDERGEQTVCIACSNSALERDLKKVQRGHNTRRILFSTFGVVAAIIVGINVFILIKDSPTSEVQKKPEISSQVSTLLECRHRLESLAKHAATFQEAFGHPPASLDDLANLVDDKHVMQEPITGAPFLIGSDTRHSIKISCPNPEVHGLAGLYAVPGKPAKMIYSNSFGVE